MEPSVILKFLLLGILSIGLFVIALHFGMNVGKPGALVRLQLLRASTVRGKMDEEICKFPASGSIL